MNSLKCVFLSCKNSTLLQHVRSCSHHTFNRILTKIPNRRGLTNKTIRDCEYYILRNISATNFLLTHNDKNDIILNKRRERVKREFQLYMEQNRERLRDTEQKLKVKKDVILKDIKETKDKVKEKVEEIIEV